ncbi:MAG: MFS transporter, partial [Planctomycetales bacterium]|nr:MFS transporter [Planctomycetales bacterium]
EMPETELMGVILMIQFVAMPGSIGFARIADSFGKKRTLLVSLAVWAFTLIAALWITNSNGFWILAAVIALVLGGTQAVSRSLMSEMIPAGQNAQYFGFFNLSGKATSFIGTFLFGAIIAMTNSSRIAMVGLLPLFLVGAWLLSKVRVSGDGCVESP